MNLDLTRDQVASLCRIVTATDCTEDDVRTALSLYPGQLTHNDCYSLSSPVGKQIADSVAALGNERAYFSQSFVLRLIEQTWAKDSVRKDVVGNVPVLVRPPRWLGPQVAAVKSGIDDVLSRIPPGASRGKLGDAAAFGLVCQVRDALVDAVAALDRFATLKGLHDALHLLQVFGTPWLDQIPPPPGAVSAPLAGLLAGVEAVAAQPGAALSPDDAASFVRCRATVQDAGNRLATGNPDERDYAHAALRSMVMQELPQIDAAMFAVSRRFPLRSFSTIFVDDASRNAAIDICDTLRRRLMEHSLWQAADRRLYAVEQFLAAPTAALLSQLATGPLAEARFNLRALFDADVAERAIAPLEDAVTRYAELAGLDRPDASAAAVGEMRMAFAALRDAARSGFLEADRALLHDFGSLLALQPGLRDLLARVPAICQLWLPS